MKTTTRRNIVLSAALLGIGSTLGIANPTLAAPRHRDNRDDRRENREERREVKQAHKEVKRERKDVRRADTPAERRDARRDLNDAREDLRGERRESRQNNGGGRFDNRGRLDNRPTWNNRPNYAPNYGNGRTNNGGQSWTGTVTRVRSDRSFDFSVGGSTFNVYSNSLLPRGLNQGDVMRVSGVRQDKNDVRNASVRLVNNR